MNKHANLFDINIAILTYNEFIKKIRQAVLEDILSFITAHGVLMLLVV